MATNGPLDTWRVGEHKTIRWTVRDENKRIVDVSNWTTTARVYRRRQDQPVLAVESAVLDAAAGTVESQIRAADTILLGPGSYRLLLWRVNVGAEQVLAADDLILSAPGV